MRTNGTRTGQLLLVGLLLLIALGTVVYLSIDQQAREAYFAGRATRLMAQLAHEVGAKIKLYQGIVENAAKDRDPKTTIDTLVPQLDYVDGKDSEKCTENPATGAAFRPFDEGAGEFYLYFRSTPDDAASDPSTCARTSIKKFLDPMLPVREFDQFLLVESSGHVIYHGDDTAVRITRFPPAKVAKDASKTEESPQQTELPTIDQLLAASTSRPIRLGDLEHRLFCQPIAIGAAQFDAPTPATPTPATPTLPETNWAVCGLIESAKFGQTTSAASKPLVALSPLLLFAAFLAWPALRIRSIGTHERMSANDVRFLCVCAVLATGMVNCLALYGLAYSQQVAQLDERLETVGKRLHDNLLAELTATHAALQEYANQVVSKVRRYDSPKDPLESAKEDISGAMKSWPKSSAVHRDLETAIKALNQLAAQQADSSERQVSALKALPSRQQAPAQTGKLADHQQKARGMLEEAQKGEKESRQKLKSALDQALKELRGDEAGTQVANTRDVVRLWRNLIFGLPVASILNDRPVLPKFMLDDGIENSDLLADDLRKSIRAVLDQYYDFEMIGWSDSGRQQKEKWTIREKTTPLIKSTEPLPDEPWQHQPAPSCRDGSDPCKRARYTLGVRPSVNTGEPIAVMSMELEGADRDRTRQEAPYAFILPHLSSVAAPILPWTLGFALIDKEDGKVLFHSHGRRRLREWFYTELDKGNVLRAALQADRAELVAGNYHGAPYRMYARPVAGTPVALVVFADLEPHRIAYTEALFTAMMAFAAYVLLGFLGVTLLRELWPAPDDTLLWPTSTRKRRYDSCAVCLAALAGVFAWAIYRHSGLTLAAFTLLVPLAAMGSCRFAMSAAAPRRRVRFALLTLFRLSPYILLSVTLWIAGDTWGIAMLGVALGWLALRWARPGTKKPPAGTRFEVSYVCFLLALIAVVAALPSFAILKDCLTQTQELLWRREQLQFASNLARRASPTKKVESVAPPSYVKARLWDVSDIHAPAFDVEPSSEPRPTLLRNPRLACACGHRWMPLSPFELDASPLIPICVAPIPKVEGCSYCIADSRRTGFGDVTEKDDSVVPQGASPTTGFIDWMLGPVAPGSIREAQLNLLRRHFTSIFGALTLPVYNRTAGKLRYAAYDSASDGRWTSHIDGTQATLQYFDARFDPYMDDPIRPSMIVRGKVASLPFPARPLGWILLAVLFSIVIAVGLWTLRWLARCIFGTNCTWEIESAPPAPVTGRHELWICPPPGKVDQLAATARRIDLRSQAQLDAEFREDAGAKAPGSRRTIVVDHFDHGFPDLMILRDRVALLERLLARGIDRLVIASGADPIQLLLELRRNSPADSDRVVAGKLLDQLAPLLEQFRRVDFPSSSILAPTPELRAKLAEECSATARLGGIEAELLEKNWMSRSEAELLSHLLDHARAHYFTLWSRCTRDERLAMVHLAQEGFVNPKTWKTVERLQSRGLVRVTPRLRLMNETFCRFVRSVESSERIKAWESAGHSTWQRLRVVLVALSLGAGVFLFVTQRDVFDTSIAMLTALAGSVPLIIRLAGLFQRGASTATDK